MQALSIVLGTLLFTCGAIDAVAQTTLTGSVWDGNGGPLTQAGNPYIVPAFGTVTVPNGRILTIEPGVIVRMGDGSLWDIAGNLAAVGGVSDSIRFIPDPAGIRWLFLLFRSGSSSNLKYCSLASGGKFGNPQIMLQNPASLSLEQSSVRWGEGDGLRGEVGNGTAGTLLVSNCSFAGNGENGIDVALWKGGAVVLSDNDMTSNAASAYRVSPDVYPSGGTLAGNGFDGVELTGGLATASGTYYHSLLLGANSTLTVADSAAVTIAPGVVVRNRDGASWDIHGALRAVGTPAKRIVFTADAPNQPWLWVLFRNGSAGTLAQCVFEYGGKFGNPQIMLQNPDSLELVSSTIRFGMGDGMQGDIGNGAASRVLVANSTFDANGEDGIDLRTTSDGIAILLDDTLTNNKGSAFALGPDLYPAGCVLARNGFDGVALSPGVIARSGRYEYGIRFSQKTSMLTVSDSATVTIAPGVSVGMTDGSSWDVYGAFLAEGDSAQPIRLTRADEFQHWAFFIFRNGSTGRFRHCAIDFGGKFKNPQLVLQSPAELLLEHASVSQGEGDGVRGDVGLASPGSLIVKYTQFDNNGGVGINVRKDPAGTVSIENNILTYNKDAAYRLGPDIYPAGDVLSGNGFDGMALIGGPTTRSGMYESDLLLEQSATVNVQPGVRVTLAPGLAVRQREGAGWDISGELTAAGDSARRIRFTSDEPGRNWSQMIVRTGSSAVLRNCDVEFGGRFDVPQVSLMNPRSLVIDNSTFGAGGGDGLYGWVGNSDSGDVSIAGSVFFNNAGSGADLSVYPAGAAQIRCCTFSGNGKDGVRLAGAAVAFVNNSIGNNARNGLTNTGAATVDAAMNWWDSPTGPGGIGPGSGDEIALEGAGTVTFAPWLTSPSIPACGAGFAIQTVTPAVLLNGPGRVTVRIAGRGFSPASTIALQRPDTTVQPASVVLLSSSLLEATFEATGARIGMYRIVVADSQKLASYAIPMLPYLPVIDYSYYNGSRTAPGRSGEHYVILKNHGSATGVALLGILKPPGFTFDSCLTDAGGKILSVIGDSVVICAQPVEPRSTRVVRLRWTLPWNRIVASRDQKQWGTYTLGDQVRFKFAVFGTPVPEAWSVIERESQNLSDNLDGGHWSSLTLGGAAGDDYLGLDLEEREEYTERVGAEYPFIADALVVEDWNDAEFFLRDASGQKLESFAPGDPESEAVAPSEPQRDGRDDRWIPQWIDESWKFTKAFGTAVYDEWESGRAGTRLLAYFEGIVEGVDFGLYRPNLGASELAHVTGVTEQELGTQRFVGNVASLLIPGVKFRAAGGAGKTTKLLTNQIPKVSDRYLGLIKFAQQGNRAEPIHKGFDLLWRGERNLVHYGVHKEFGAHIGIGWSAKVVAKTEQGVPIYGTLAHFYKDRAFFMWNGPGKAIFYKDVLSGPFRVYRNLQVAGTGVGAYKNIARQPSDREGCTEGSTTLSAAFDPNHIDAFPAGPYILPSQRISYTIGFENLAQATQPAADVVVSLPLDGDIDSSSILLEASSHMSLVETFVNAARDTVTWRFAGIGLPPNVTPPEGEGWVRLSVAAKDGAPSGTELTAQARIVFDSNPPIVTNLVRHVIDIDAPSSAAMPLPDTVFTASIPIRFTARDSTSAVDKVELYVARRSLDSGVFTPFDRYAVVSGDSASVPFVGLPGNEYRFYTKAIDLVGISELDPDSADASTVFAKTTGIRPESTAPASLEAFLYPNPVERASAFDVRLRSGASLTIRVYDIFGREAIPASYAIDLPAGNYRVPFVASGLPNGVYYCRITAEGRAWQSTVLRKMIVSR